MRLNHIAVLFVICVLTLPCCALTKAEEAGAEEVIEARSQERYAIGIVCGNTYKPHDDIRFLQLSAFALVGCDTLWPCLKPSPLHFKVECHAGTTVHERYRTMVSAGLMIVLYLGETDRARFRPYVEGGSHVIYDDFQIPGQGLRVNFNPQGGVGAEFDLGNAGTFYTTLRIQHISNASIHRENAGIDSIALIFGRFF